jgi:ankyrin repeat protein
MPRAGTFRLSVLGAFALATSGCNPFAPDPINAVRTGNADALKAALARDPTLVHTKVYPQAYERPSQQAEYLSRHGRSAWEGRYLIHDAVGRGVDPLPVLEVLAAAGADLKVRLKGRTLLHIAAADGNLEVAGWLIAKGAALDAPNDCSDHCAERGNTPLHDALNFRDDAMSALLLERGTDVHARGANGWTPLHLAGDRGKLGGAFVLCRYGADPALKDSAGKTPYVVARASWDRHVATRTKDFDMLVQWLQPGGGCETVAETARKSGKPMSDEDARTVFTATVPAAR